MDTTDLHERRQRVLAALTYNDGTSKPWLAAEEIGYSSFLENVSLRQIVAALVWLKSQGLVQHAGVEWRLTREGLRRTWKGL